MTRRLCEVVVCDDCGEEAQGLWTDDPEWRPGLYYRWLQAKGWKRIGEEKDVCPGCVKIRRIERAAAATKRPEPEESR